MNMLLLAREPKTIEDLKSVEAVIVKSKVIKPEELRKNLKKMLIW